MAAGIPGPRFGATRLARRVARRTARRPALDIAGTARAAIVINQGVRELGLRLQKRDGGTVVFERVRPDRPYPDTGQLMDQLLFSLARLERRFPIVAEYLGAKTNGILID